MYYTAVEQATHSEHARVSLQTLRALGDLTNTHLAAEATQAGLLFPRPRSSKRFFIRCLYTSQIDHQNAIFANPNGKREPNGLGREKYDEA